MTDGPGGVGAAVGVVAAGGALPFAVAESIASGGRRPVIFALRGICDPDQVGRFRHHWISIGQLGRLAALLRQEAVRDVMFIGAMVRPAWSDIKLDWFALRNSAHLLAAFRGGDDRLLSGVAGILERDGFRFVGIKDVAPDLLMPPGCLTATIPDAAALADIARGRDVLNAMSPFDIGQGAVVIDGHVVAVEGVEGTDGLLARLVQLRANGRIRAGAGRGVLVKMPKAGQDLRFDLPALGPKTIEGVATAGLAGIAALAGHTLVAEPQEMVAAADRARVFIVGVPA